MTETKIDGLPVHGYKPQGGAVIHMVNHNKRVEERVLRLLDELQHSTNVDPRWLAIGRTQIEQGFMAVNRALFQPGRVVLPEDAPKPDPDDLESWEAEGLADD